MKIKKNNIEYILPDCLIVGAAKSGTTALFKFLENYDEIFCPTIKEPWFFSHMNEQFNYIHPLTKEDLSRHIINNIDGIKSQSIDSDIMPPGNLTGMTEIERQKLAEWIKAGTPINN